MPGDLSPETFREAMHRVADMVADYLEGVAERPVLPACEPGDLSAALPAEPPARGEPIERQLEDYRRLIEPSLTHWNHPGFLAYFSSTASGPGILGETLAAGTGANAMLWRTSPAATELEDVVCGWMRRMLGLPEAFQGHINDSASISTFLALAAARGRDPELEVRDRGLAGRPELGAMCLYASREAHSSVDKAVLALGLGLSNLRRIATDEAFRMDPAALRRAIEEDLRAGRLPIAVVATVGTTSSTSVDPVAEIAAIAREHDLWLHVDAAWAGSAAICPEYRRLMRGMERADSIVVNPHKWLFTPLDCSLLFVRDVEAYRRTFSLVPDYLETDRESAARDLMGLGIQLGRRFRALKLWMVIRTFGVEGLQERIREHCRLGRELAERIAREEGFEVVAPTPFSTVCFRLLAGESEEERDRRNERLLEAVNAEGLVFLSHTRLRGRYVLRISVSNLRTDAEHVETAWDLIRHHARKLLAEENR